MKKNSRKEGVSGVEGREKPGKQPKTEGDSGVEGRGKPGKQPKTEGDSSSSQGSTTKTTSGSTAVYKPVYNSKNLLKNGDFSQNDLKGPNTWIISKNLPGWETSQI